MNPEPGGGFVQGPLSAVLALDVVGPDRSSLRRIVPEDQTLNHGCIERVPLGWPPAGGVQLLGNEHSRAALLAHFADCAQDWVEPAQLFKALDGADERVTGLHAAGPVAGEFD